MKLRIGNVELDNNLILAPMAGVTDMSFRQLCREQGCGLLVTEMVSAKAILYKNRNTKELMAIGEGERPVSLQLFGSDPEIVSDIAHQVEDGPYDIIDLNMGCPVPKIVGNGEGSALMKNPKLVEELLSALVMQNCFRVGLFKQGLLHDLSKYSPAEFLTGVHYYQGDRSPNAAEREEKGYSSAWLHHKGRNKHHFEYWIDFSRTSQGIAGAKMPVNYLVEMVMDRIAACKVYRGKDYTDASAWEYYQRERPYLNSAMHTETRAELEKILIMLKQRGEKTTFSYLRKLLKKGNY